ncbi:MAG: 7-cyano-7-deazaguanine synthase QueC, partial [Lachnospiraceae bacterium]|nr:7-cyano-7-deazaguanine synthase QueC [Lachnospiraceae bacterium]
AYPDTSEAFHEAISRAVYEGSGKQLEIEAPFLYSHKADVVRAGMELQVPFAFTWSCYEGGEKACGKCATCMDRMNAFALNGIQDPIEYESS